MPSKKNNYSTFLFQVEKPDFVSRYTQIIAIVTLALICYNILYNFNFDSDFTLQGKIMNIPWTYFFLWLLVTIINCSLGKSSGKSTCNKIGYLGMLFLSFLSFISFLIVTILPDFFNIFNKYYYSFIIQMYLLQFKLSILSLFMLVAIVNIIRYISN